MKKIEQKVLRFIDDNELLQKGDKVLIALSGGPDSVFLLHFLNKYRRKFETNLAVFHLNHNIRGKAADKDEKFCKKLCDKLKVEFYLSSKDVKKIAAGEKISIEEAGRKVRYEELQKVANEHGFNKIATAHNANDNAETVLLNLIKGTGLRGISGIPVKRYNIIRPILVLTKKEILDYLEKGKLSYKLDKSNLSDDYERNYIRNKIVPLIKKKLNPSFESSVLNSSFNFRNQLNIFEKKINDEIKSLYEVEDGILKIDLEQIEKKEKSERPEIVKLLIERNFSNQVTFKDVSNVLSLLNRESGISVNLSGKLTAARERKHIFIGKNKIVKDFPDTVIRAGENVKINGNTVYINNDIKLPEKFPNNHLVEYISADNLDEVFILRRWQDGDWFYPLGLKGTKKISDFLNEHKIISSDKKNQLVLTNGGRIVWVLGLRIDDRFKITNSTKRIYQICLM